MLTPRGTAVLATGILLWVASRLVGSSDLHMAALAFVVLPLLSLAFIRWTRHRLRVTRRLSHRRVFAGSPLLVDLEVRNESRSDAAMVMLEDRLPSGLGRAARAVLGGLKARARQTVSYTIQCGRRGRYRIGPAVARVTDPFGLAHRRVRFEDEHDVIVYPEVEDLRDLGPARAAGGSGETSARRLYRTGEEFYGMRQYQTGDDLRQIHWPSTARIGNLMIRQDESGRRSSATVFLDTRRSSYPDGEAALERAISAAASVGSLFLRTGVDIHLGSIDLPPRALGPDAYLKTLALIKTSRGHGLGPALAPLRDRSSTGSSMLLVTGVLDDEDLSALLAATGGFGHKVAILVTSARPDEEPLRRIRVAMARGEWRVVILPVDRRLRDVWTHGAGRPAAAAARF